MIKDSITCRYFVVKDFMFELSKEEFKNWRRQFGTSNEDRMGYKP
jgi:hypothetical protein